jgi:hypothetical protein
MGKLGKRISRAGGTAKKYRLSKAELETAQLKAWSSLGGSHLVAIDAHSISIEAATGTRGAIVTTRCAFCVEMYWPW